MSNREGIYYVFMMAGMIVSVTIGRIMGWPNLVGLLVGVGVGAGLGHLSGWLVDGMKKPKNDEINQFNKDSIRSESQMDVSTGTACKNPYCGWTGVAATSRYCPRCGEPLPGK